LFAAWVSPSHEWVVLEYWPAHPDPSELFTIKLLNLRTNILKDLDVNPHQYIIQAPPIQSVAWSPDSQFFVMSINTVNRNLNDESVAYSASLYSIRDGSITKLNTPQVLQTRFIWSTDSSLIAIEGETSAPNGNELTLNIINTKTNQLIQSLPFGGADGMSIFAMCSLIWSPDQRYIAFVDSCMPYPENQGQEVRLWDLQSNAFIQVTSAASDLYRSTANPGLLTSLYTLNWLPPHTLLIGELIRLDTKISTINQIQTLSYNAQSQATSIFAPGKLTEIAINPVTGRFVSSIESSYSSITGSPETTQTRIGNFTVNTTNATMAQSTIANIPYGTDLGWSPDGKMLAYHQTGTNNFVFVTDGASPAVSYTFSDSSVAADSASKTAYILPIGWLPVNALNMNTLTPIASPVQPTPTGNGGSAPGGNQING